MNNTHHQDKGSLRDSILSKIQSEKIAMRPRLYFTLQIAAVAIIAIVVLLLSIFIFNFILFSIRINSHDVFLSFGPRGIKSFFVFFPWPLLVLDIAFIALLEWLIRKFRFGYRLPMLYLLGAIIALTFVAGLAIDRGTPFNDRMLVRAGGPGLPPPIGMMYRGSERPAHDGVCRCVITAISRNILTVETHERGASTSTLTIVLPENDPRATTTNLSVGDMVFVAGDREGDTIRAFGVHKFEPGTRKKFIFYRDMPTSELR